MTDDVTSKTTETLQAELLVAQQKIRELEAENKLLRQQLSLTNTSVPLIFWSTNIEGIFTVVTGYGLEAWGDIGKTLVGQSSLDFYQEYPKLVTHIQQALVGEFSSTVVQYQCYTYEGFFTPLRDKHGGLIGMAAILIDITHHYSTNKTLRNYLIFIETLLNTMPHPVFYQEMGGLYLGCNDVYAKKILGVSRQDVVGRSVFDFPETIPFDLAEYFYAKSQELLQYPDLGIQQYEVGITGEDGIERQYMVTKTTFSDITGNVIGIIGAMSDVTERKQMKSLLLQRTMELSLLNRASQEFISSLDLNIVLATVLEETRQLLDVTGCSAWLLTPQGQALVCEHATVFNVNDISLRGWRLALGQGVVGWVAEHGENLIVNDTREDSRHYKEIDKQLGYETRSLLSVPLKIPKTDKPIGVLQVVDVEPHRFNAHALRIVEPLAANAAIAIENARLYKQAQQDAEMKATLLQEVNHRVKNNLAAIIGLLYAERRHFVHADGKHCEDTMNNIISRVQGLATAHKLLSISKWAPIRLHILAQQVIESAIRMAPLQKRLSVEVNQTEIEVTAKQANGLALVINELTTNTIKHALNYQKSFKIKVAIDYQQGVVTFVFQDNGPGYPPELLDAKQSNVGFYLIETIVRNELGGRLSLSNQHGAMTAIYFPSTRKV